MVTVVVTVLDRWPLAYMLPIVGHMTSKAYSDLVSHCLPYGVLRMITRNLQTPYLICRMKQTNEQTIQRILSFSLSPSLPGIACHARASAARRIGAARRLCRVDHITNKVYIMVLGSTRTRGGRAKGLVLN